MEKVSKCPSRQLTDSSRPWHTPPAKLGGQSFFGEDDGDEWRAKVTGTSETFMVFGDDDLISVDLLLRR